MKRNKKNILTLLVLLFFGFFSCQFLFSTGNIFSFQKVWADDEEDEREEDEDREDDEKEDDDRESSTATVSSSPQIETKVTTDTKTVILPDSDGDGIVDRDDPHPEVAEIYLVEDKDFNGIVDKFEGNEE